MLKEPRKIYPLGDRVPGVSSVEQRNYMAGTTSEVRAPKKGEWYLSGALPHAYLAHDDLTQQFTIMALVKIKRLQVIEVQDGTGQISRSIG